MSAWLHFPQLHSCLGPDLASAAQQVMANKLPQPCFFNVHERQQQLPYYSSQPSLSLLPRLQQMLAAMQRDCHSFDQHLLLVASSGLDIAGFEQLTHERGHFKAEYSTPLHQIADRLQQQFDFSQSMTINTACSSAANALLYGAGLLDQYTGVVVLAFEPRSLLIQQGFAALELTSTSTNYQPFHPQRDGLILGEACAAVLLNKEASGSNCRLLGGYSACDTSSVTGTREDGSHILHVTKQALVDANIDASSVDLIKLHGTATTANDDAETAGNLHWLKQEQKPAFCALKPWLGHNLGACGLTETLLLAECLAKGHLPAHTSNATDLQLPLTVNSNWPLQRSRVLANFFGFGGNNACLALEVYAHREQA